MARPVVAGIVAVVGSLAPVATQAPGLGGTRVTVVTEARDLMLSGVAGTGVVWLQGVRDEICHWGLPEEKVGRIPIDGECQIASGCGAAGATGLLAVIHRDGRDRLNLWRPIGEPAGLLPLPTSGRVVGLDVDVSEGVVRALVLIRGVTDSWVVVRGQSAPDREVEASHECPEGMMWHGPA